MNRIFIRWLISFVFTLIMSAFILYGTFQLGHDYGQNELKRIAVGKGNGYIDEKGRFNWIERKPLTPQNK